MPRKQEKDLLKRITVHPKVVVGKPAVRGLRITVEQILKSLAGGVSTEELLEDYPELEREDIHAVPLYAAELANEKRIYAVSAR